MTQRGTDPEGLPLGLDGQPLQPGRGSVPGVVIVPKGDAMAKATKNGRYELNGRYFRIRKGDELPKGATLIADAPKPQERARTAAPENKSRKAAPEAK